MRIFYPYNEILPKKRAHDLYIFHECAALAQAGYETTLLCGKGSNPNLFHYYGISSLDNLHIKQLPLIRKNNLLNWSWNLPFFFKCQQQIRKHRPEFVFLSVLKQGAYHLSHKVKQSKYIYEVHELSYYPNQLTPKKNFRMEKTLLSRADLITVTTSALKEILRAPPYSLSIPIKVVPLAVHKAPLPPPPEKADPLTLMYVGQLYSGQGLEHLLAAMQQVEGVCLKVIGGKAREVESMIQLAKRLHVSQRVEFLGFHPPHLLPEIVKEAHAFVSSFEPKGRMPFVAHTKLLEYASWGRPFIVPNLSVVREHFPTGKGVLFFEAGQVSSLAESIQKLQDSHLRKKLQKESLEHGSSYSWGRRAERYRELFTQLGFLLSLA
ncbi:MAG: glycosyltransferase family 4 protein [Chlamydiales bacterium]